MNPTDTAFIIICAALVMFMTPGLALFYAGMTRSKNALGTIMQSFAALGVITLVWIFWGYSLSFGTDMNGLIGGLDFVGMAGVGMEPHESIATNLPHMVFMIFQCMFAIITPALISGAFAERMRFSAFIIFIILWCTFVYAPLCHWVWGGGWMAQMGAMDFAGGAVVHMSSASAALAAVLVIGKRKGYGKRSFLPHNLPMTMIGTALLWFGWFGFNAGSALAADGLAGNAFVTTHIAAATAMLAWVFAEWKFHGKPTTLGAASGAVAGLVAITPAAGFVGIMASVLIGLGAGVLCYFGVSLKARFGYDDSLDVVGIHGVGGVWGALATGLFASQAINPAGFNGLFYGNPGQLWIQFVSVVATCAFSFVVSYVLLKIVNAIVPIRVTEEEEEAGLDVAIHSESAYQA
ncbi:Amt family ammonium transporter [Desulfomicrobium macestii]|uniref:Ammonium transporter n=2 Tax=Desulfomicrobium TaxID=898 RepID=A0A8G2F3G4_DESNO|nr:MULTISPECIES: ammonium transporter [Desulfomicrobium]MBE1423989.1 Amt family ammonium transporter [Desulfomicrobium macestii]SFL42565.1 ammonium transporter [Desulfomicrobium norvegicum]